MIRFQVGLYPLLVCACLTPPAAEPPAALGKVRALHASASNLDREALDCLLSTGSSAAFEPPAGGAALVELPIAFYAYSPAK